jgi:Na+/melibiose symporter-like transporter
MMEFTLILMTLIVLLLPPLCSALMAQSFGRSFWKWFMIGCLLPMVANVILFFLPSKRPQDQRIETK